MNELTVYTRVAGYSINDITIPMLKKLVFENMSKYLEIVTYIKSLRLHESPLWCYVTTIEDEEIDMWGANYSSLDDKHKMILLLHNLANIQTYIKRR